MLTKADHLHRHKQTLLKKGDDLFSFDHRIDAESALVIPRPTPPPPLTNSSRSGNRKRTSRAYSIASLEEEEEEETEEEEEEEEEEQVKEEEIDEDLLLGSCLSNGSCPATGLKVDKISEQKAKEAKAEEKEAEARGGAGTGEEEGEDMGPPSKRHKTSSPNVVVNPNSSSSPSDNTSSQPEMYSGNRISVIGQHTDNGGGGGSGLANNGGHGLSSFGLHDMNHLNQLHHHGIYGDDGAIPQLSSRGGGGNIEARFLVSSRVSFLLAFIAVFEFDFLTLTFSPGRRRHHWPWRQQHISSSAHGMFAFKLNFFLSSFFGLLLPVYLLILFLFSPILTFRTFVYCVFCCKV